LTGRFAPGNGSLRLLAWNIWHGGGCRLARIVAALATHDADVVVLCEYRRRTSAALCAALAALGYEHTSGIQPPPGRNGVLIAARHPLRARAPLSHRVEEPHRMLDVEVAGLRLVGVYLPSSSRPPFCLGPLGSTRRGNQSWLAGPTVPARICSGDQYLDEEPGGCSGCNGSSPRRPKKPARLCVRGPQARG
jgi:hypothetical protein